MRLLFCLFYIVSIFEIFAQSHPSLTLTQAGIDAIRLELGNVPKFDKTLSIVVNEVDNEIAKGIHVPFPKDLAGGYTHEQHKNNFFVMQKSGVLFQLTNNEKYANFIRDMLLSYAELFPKIDRHPATRSYARGKFFWQCLNDANWLVYTSQAYDCIYEWLDKKTIKKLNSQLFRPYADFLSEANPQFFNRIHNHSTWGNAAVGMIGLVMEDDELIQRALYGLESQFVTKSDTDNDGGLIQMEGQTKAGFFAQIDYAFSPDGYYTEGPYYQRYAMYPFLIFAQSLANSKPELKLFEYKSGVLLKGVYALINQTNSADEFFPINDAQKGMSLYSRELITAISMAYYYGNKDSQLLSYIKMQSKVPLNITGLEASIALREGEAVPYRKQSIQLSDGAMGNEGALGILRKTAPNENEITLLMKYPKHGMGHGHFDKLSFLVYHNEKEVFQDYGAARWVNIEHKDGGGYLKENTSWAKQTIAHNTLVVNKKSQFLGKSRVADKYHGTPYLFQGDGKVQVMSAKENMAYEGVDMQRTMVMIEDEALSNPLILDILQADSELTNHYDLPFYFQGHLMRTNFDYIHQTELNPMGNDHGYQHLWSEAIGNSSDGVAQMTWLNGSNFYTLTTAVAPDDSLVFGRIGANDPNFNLRRDPVFILRRANAKNACFASAMETHGHYSPVSERPVFSHTQVLEIKILRADNEYTATVIRLKTGENFVFVISNLETDQTVAHHLILNQEDYQWEGPFHLFKTKTNFDE